MKESFEMGHAGLAVWVETPSLVLLGDMLCQYFFIPKENFGLNYPSYLSKSGFPCDSEVKNLPANAGNLEDADLMPETGRSPGGGNGNPLQYSCLENLMGRGDWSFTSTWHSHTAPTTLLLCYTQTFLLSQLAFSTSHLFGLLLCIFFRVS